MFSGFSLDLINAFAKNRTKPNMNSPTAKRAPNPSLPSAGRIFSWLLSLRLDALLGQRPAPIGSLFET
jgi:hypothetical protein